MLVLQFSHMWIFSSLFLRMGCACETVYAAALAPIQALPLVTVHGYIWRILHLRGVCSYLHTLLSGSTKIMPTVFFFFIGSHFYQILFSI